MSRICEACENQRWLIFITDPGTYEVMRCDACAEHSLTDRDATILAKQAGLLVNDAFVVSKKEVRRWMKLYPNRGINPATAQSLRAARKAARA